MMFKAVEDASSDSSDSEDPALRGNLNYLLLMSQHETKEKALEPKEKYKLVQDKESRWNFSWIYQC